MAIRSLQQRLGRIEKRMLIPTTSTAVDTSSHAELTHRLRMSRSVLHFEREAVRLLRQLTPGQFEECLASIDQHDDCIRDREQEVDDLEQQCRAAGMSEEEISQAQ